MKKIALLSLLSVFTSLGINAQPFTALHENFDVACVTSTTFPPTSASWNWIHYNPVSGTDLEGLWHCTPTNGRKNNLGSPTPGFTCSGVWASAYHLDTSYLISPQLSLHGYDPGHLYLHFDTKVDSIVLGGKLAVLITTDTGSPSAFVYTDFTTSVTPGFGVADSLGWVTHELDITSYVPTYYPIYIVFRYISPSTSGSAWYLDNVNTSTTRLSTPNIHKEILPITVLGSGSSSHISLSYGTQISGIYRLAIYDMMGRSVHQETINIMNGSSSLSIDELNLQPGMYFVKMGNGYSYGAVKVIIN